LDQSLIEIAVLAAVAGFVLFRLYATLGRRTGAEPPPRPAPVQGPFGSDRAVTDRPLTGAATAPGSDGIAAIVRADSSFNAEQFLTGARGAYEIILTAYAKADRDALRTLLTPRVYESYMKALDERAAKNEQGPELVRLRNAELADADLTGSVARVTVKFEAELAQGATGIRDAREKWTFERDIRSNDPNWRLARVTAA
jgi:predicted lipid-binding transport protein (Tim44 family)